MKDSHRAKPQDGSLFYCRLTWRMPPLFGPRGRKKTYTEDRVVTAPDIDGAINEAKSRCSVLALEYGVTIEAVPIDLTGAVRALAKYDGPPMNDNHTPTKAKLVVTRLS